MIGEGMAIGIRRETSTVSKAGSELARASMPASIPLPVFDESALRRSVRRMVLPMTLALSGGMAVASGGGTTYNITIDGRSIESNRRLRELLALLVEETTRTVRAKA